MDCLGCRGPHDLQSCSTGSLINRNIASTPALAEKGCGHVRHERENGFSNQPTLRLCAIRLSDWHWAPVAYSSSTMSIRRTYMPAALISALPILVALVRIAVSTVD